LHGGWQREKRGLSPFNRDWGWSNKGSDDELVRRLADEEQRRVASEKAAETAEFTAAQALLDKHIAVEEAQAHALAAGQTMGTTRSR